MPRGGWRGTPRKSFWPSEVKADGTCTIRVPRNIKERVLKAAHQLDRQMIGVDDVGPGTVLNGLQLSLRFGLNRGAVSKMRLSKNFTQWSQQKDPAGIGWVRIKGGYKPYGNIN